MRYDESVVAKVFELKGTGLGARRIGKLLGMSHMTVSRILKGHVPGKKIKESKARHAEEKREQREFEKKHFPKVVSPEAIAERGHGRGLVPVEYQRCRGCGGMVQVGVECMVCRTRRMSEFDCYLNDLLSVGHHYPAKGMR